MTDDILIEAPNPEAVRVATAAFHGLQRGAATGDWSGFIDQLSDDVRIMIPVPPGLPDPPEGVLVGKDAARRLFATHQGELVHEVRLECKRATANGDLVVLEVRVEGHLGGAPAANYFVFAFETGGGKVVSMYEYAVWTAKDPDSRWGDPSFAREAFPETLIPLPAEFAAARAG